MRNAQLAVLVLISLALSACERDPLPDSSNLPAACSDGIDNDFDGRIDFPDDPGCDSPDDREERQVDFTAVCSDGLDNDRDGLADFPLDPGCLSAADDNELDPPVATACADGIDNDGDGNVDYPADPGCVSGSDDSETTPRALPICADGLDNDGDGLTDWPADPDCSSAADNTETTGPNATCSDGIDNDNDGRIDFPFDPGCASPTDNDETDPLVFPECFDGVDNDGDGLIDFPVEPGCAAAADNDETDPVPLPKCADGIDNDLDQLIDFPADPGCQYAAFDDEVDPNNPAKRTRYEMANGCWALRANGRERYVTRDANGFAATARSASSAEPFYMKPSALGKYLLYARNRRLLNIGGPGIGELALADADDSAEWTVTGVGDTTLYPPTPLYHVEPTPAEVATYHGFTDPELRFSEFTLTNELTTNKLTAQPGGSIVGDSDDLPAQQSFSFEPLPAVACARFPEASSNFSGTPFRGTVSGGRVLGHVDAHVHVSATEFLGGAEWGRPFHKFGVTHALGDCAVNHGDMGQWDFLGAAYAGDSDGHTTDGYPTFTEWPERGSLTHEAIYWKWLERSWASGLRVLVNDLVDNETLCELYRDGRNVTDNVPNQPEGRPGAPGFTNPASFQDCNSMNNAGRQAQTMYGMQDYIDAQYGGRGKGFFQIVHTPDEARAVIADGKMAVILGIEISNLFDCQLTYSPFRSERPFEETGDGLLENSYGCTTAEGQPNSILTQMERIHGWGVRQIISIHEFDNAFGGNGIFDGFILNLGNRENTGGIPHGLYAGPFDTSDEPTGEFWTTYDCPEEGVTPNFSGYLWSDKGGSTQQLGSPFYDNFCEPAGTSGLPTVFLGQEGRAGGPTPCYPAGQQCNARWMTPAGLYTYAKMMELGFIFDFDHMEMGMKTQALQLAEAQNPPYPFVSTHGTFGGTTIDQATRVLRNGGVLYPSNGSSRGFRGDLAETLGIYNTAMIGIPPAQRPLFGFGYGTDTNGLSRQSGPRGSIAAGDELRYPFTLFDGGVFDQLPEFNGIEGVVFHQPASVDENGIVRRTWHEDIDGNAHHGMIADFMQEIVIEGTPDDIRHVFNAAEAYLQMWERTLASQAAIQARGGIDINVLRPAILREAPPAVPFYAEVP